MYFRRLANNLVHYFRSQGLFIALAVGALSIARALPPFQLFQDRAASLLQSHLLEELFSIIVSILIAVIAWHDFQHTRATRSVILFSGFLTVAVIDLVHALTYDGMPKFITETSTQRAIFFWLAGRTYAAITLLLLIPDVKMRFSAFAWLTLALLIISITFYIGTWRLYWIPNLYEPGVGTTAIKRNYEYALVMLDVITALLFISDSRQKKQAINFKFATSCLIMGMGELVFSNYKAPSDFLNNFGHVFKIVSYGFLYNAMFVTAIRSPYERVQHLAFHDHLTGLPNRILVQDRFEQAKGQAVRNQSQMALLFLDIDNFKAFNDNLGHASGDEVLKIAAARLEKCIREIDTVSRVGGDEFILIVTNLKNADETALVVTKIMESLRQPFIVNADEYEVSVSIGVAIFPKDGATLDELRKNADRAMYQAKEAGKNTFLFFDSATFNDVNDSLLLRKHLKQALERREFELYYQPQYELFTGEIIGAEALVRWRHPEQGLLSPGHFIPAAEAFGLIVPIGEWVLNAACREAKRWQQTGFRNLSVAVNCSAIQFRRGDLEISVENALKSTGLEPSMLELELTETILIQNVDQVLKTLKNLKSLGIKMSIDDFGTGYSSLSYIKQFDVDKLKIDQSFVRDILVDPDDAAIVKAVIQMADSLGLAAIAEGVESEEIADMLKSLGCREGQGYYFSYPIKAEALMRLLLRSANAAERFYFAPADGVRSEAVKG